MHNDSCSQKFVVTIDGLAGSGKDTLAEHLDRARFFYPYSVSIFNTGDLYRATAAQLLEAGLEPGCPEFSDAAAYTMTHLDFFALNKENLFCSEVEKLTPDVVKVKAATENFIGKVPQIIDHSPEDVVIVLGRNTGRLLYPHANAKIYLNFSAETCARRKALGMAAKGCDYRQSYLHLLERNQRDIANWGETFTPAKEAFVLQDKPDKKLDAAAVCKKTINRYLEERWSAWNNQRYERYGF